MPSGDGFLSLYLLVFFVSFKGAIRTKQKMLYSIDHTRQFLGCGSRAFVRSTTQRGSETRGQHSTRIASAELRATTINRRLNKGNMACVQSLVVYTWTAKADDAVHEQHYH